MQIIKITDKKQLNDFVASQDKAQFLQSWEWGEFQEKVSNGIWRIGVLATNKELSSEASELSSAGEKLVAAATIIKKRLPMGKSYFFCPRGPLVNYQLSIINYQLIFEILFQEIQKISRDEGVMFLRFEPDSRFKIQDSRFKIQQTIDVQPSKTLLLDLTKTEDELLNNMHQKTRYNIRLAKKKGVKIIDADIKYFDSFWRLSKETAERDDFRLHGQDYYLEMLRTSANSREQIPLTPFAKGGNSMIIKLFIAEYKGKVIAANIVSFFGDTVSYMHGASGATSRNVMAPYLLQWFTIKLAKSLSYKYYDFFGIDEEKWSGVTRFKRGFAGEEIEYPGTYDLIFDEGWYNVYRMVRKVRRTF